MNIRFLQRASVGFVSYMIMTSFLVLPSGALADFDSTYDASCYVGPPDDNRNVGSIMVTDASSVGALCNATFYDCQDNCVGCIIDFDVDGTICFDKNGKKFLK